ncbi:hypothetical protein T492DRAFT_832780 [Pavlovales sp. CCMP2436]|nr:hypothetical protein T492DRAFT_832780 [Pavlovales sp. CCMP2436]
MSRLQRRIVRLLGFVGWRASAILAGGQPSSAAAWASIGVVKLKLTFPDATVDVDFAKLLPRVAGLALGAGERHVKVAACELLDALTNKGGVAVSTSVPKPELVYKSWSARYPMVRWLASKATSRENEQECITILMIYDF